MSYYPNSNAEWRKKRAQERARNSEAKAALSSTPTLNSLKHLADSLKVAIDSLRVEEELSERASVIGLTEASVIDLKEEVSNFEIRLIQTALRRAHGNVAQAAKSLNVKHSTLYEKVRRYNLGTMGSSQRRKLDPEYDTNQA